MHIRHLEPLKRYNTLSLTATAESFVQVQSEAELLEVLDWARLNNQSVVPLGEGSNVVLAGDINALLVRLSIGGIQTLKSGPDSVTLRVGAGECWHDVVRWTLQQGYYGLENLALIPGTVGAAPIQNIGAYGVELESFVQRVHARSLFDSREVTLDNAACQFAYRDSVFKGELRDKLIITAVDLQLSMNPSVNLSYPALQTYFSEASVGDATPQSVFDAVVHIRGGKLPDPQFEPNAGSFFKNPLVVRSVAAGLAAEFPELPRYPQPDGRDKLSAAWMIEFCGWKGFRRDNLGIHPQHALVLVNYGNDSGNDVLSLARNITQSVYEAFGVELMIEPRVYGAQV